MRAFFISLLLCGVAFGYDPPIGIPDPADTFGAFGEIDQTAPSGSSNWPSAEEAGYYYIDNTHVSATDTSNTYGYPDKPRLTVPNVVFNAGDRIEIHGDGGTAEYSGTWDPAGVGTDTNPIWFVGVDTPVFTGKLDMGSANRTERCYMVFDGLKWANGTGSGGKIDLRPRYANNSINHIIFRNCTLRGREATGQGSGFAVGSSAFVDTQVCNDIVIYNCEISHYGDKDNPNEECAVIPSFYITRFWILDSDIHDVAEDGFAGSHNGEWTTTGYYIGRNNIYNNITNAMDLKGIREVVVSENTIYNHEDIWVEGVHKSSGQGEAIVTHYAGNSTGADAWDQFPEDVTICFNTIYTSRYAIATSRHGRLRIVGNVIYDIDSDPTDYTTKTEAIYISGVKDDHWICHNTIYSSDGGIRVTDGPAAYDSGTTYYRADSVSYNNLTYVCIADDADAGISNIVPTNTSYWKTVRLQIWGNVISGRTESDQSEIDFDITAFATNSVDMDYNLAHYASGEVYHFGNTTDRDLAWIIANTPHQDNGLDSDPAFVAAGSNNFQLSVSSPAIGAATEGTGTTAYDDFFSRFGISIQYDRAGNARPQGGTWDMGAYEYVAGGDPPAAPSPSRTPAAARRAALLSR